jgi:predicted DNA binding protein
MSVIADFSVPADEFALGHLLEVRPGVQVRLESMIPTGDAVVPYFWVETPDVDAVEAALRESPLVADADVVDRLGEEALFRVVWSDDIDGIIDAFGGTEAVVLEGEGRGDHWSFQVRFPEYEALSAFYRGVVDRDVSITLDGVHNPVEASETAEFGLTPEQREVLVLALETGYFAVPRKVTMVDLAEELGISDSAVSQRLRRGLAKVLSTTLMGTGNG